MPGKRCVVEGGFGQGDGRLTTPIGDSAAQAGARGVSAGVVEVSVAVEPCLKERNE